MGGKTSQNRETQNPANRQSLGTELVMEKSPKMGDRFTGFTGGKRKKIWGPRQHTKPGRGPAGVWSEDMAKTSHQFQ